MKVRAAEILDVEIPFRFTFRHSLAARSRSHSLLVRLEDDEGRSGFGESAPRAYVTGEDTDSAMRVLEQELLPRILGCPLGSFEEAVAWIRDRLEDLPRNRHAAFCALELGLLDLAGRAFGRSSGDVAGPVARRELHYSGVISADAVEAATRALENAQRIGFRAVKLKVGHTEEEDVALLETARRLLGDRCSLRVDANCAWTAEEALRRLEAFGRFDLAGVEQPLPGPDLDGLAWLASRSPVPVIVDESLASFEDARRLVEHRACHVFNIRISKCAGLVNATRIRDLARDSGLRCMLGAQVGESALLSAAGRQLAARSEDLLFLEGSYGTLLLEQDIGSPDLTLGPGGSAGALDGHGLGVDVLESVLDGFVTRRRRVEAP